MSPLFAQISEWCAVMRRHAWRTYLNAVDVFAQYAATLPHTAVGTAGGTLLQPNPKRQNQNTPGMKEKCTSATFPGLLMSAAVFVKNVYLWKMFIHIRTHTHIYIYVYIYINIHIYIYHTDVCKCVRIICTCVYIYVCICIYRYIKALWQAFHPAPCLMPPKGPPTRAKCSGPCPGRPTFGRPMARPLQERLGFRLKAGSWQLSSACFRF